MALKQPRPKQKHREENFPGTDEDLENHADWEEKTHPKQKEASHWEFENTKTGEKVRFDLGDPSETGHKINDHYHCFNSQSKGGPKDRYLDKDGNVVPQNHETSHLYPPEGMQWKF